MSAGRRRASPVSGAVLTEADVIEIRRRAEGRGLDGMPVVIAEDYPVSVMTIRNVISRKTWKHVA